MAVLIFIASKAASGDSDPSVIAVLGLVVALVSAAISIMAWQTGSALSRTPTTPGLPW